MAQASGLSKSTVQRIWSAFGLQPHRQRHFKLSTDPFFIEKVRDVVGLYLNPPDNAVVLCVVANRCPLDLGYVEGVTHDSPRDYHAIRGLGRG